MAGIANTIDYNIQTQNVTDSLIMMITITIMIIIIIQTT